MAKVIITLNLEKEINRKFKKESVKVFELMYNLRDDPKKGKQIGHVGGIVTKEIKYKVYRFYFITDGYKIKFLRTEELTDLVIKFVRMSDKDKQQTIINEIKNILRIFGEEGF